LKREPDEYVEHNSIESNASSLSSVENLDVSAKSRSKRSAYISVNVLYFGEDVVTELPYLSSSGSGDIFDL